ncbi:MAG: peptidylprolyl isomerase [Prevotella sp.]|nr:peptidylprolyl isomerase [Prevotella sp.]
MKYLLSIILSLVSLSLFAQSEADTVRQKVLFQTSMGDIVIALYNETPLHRDNFIAHVKNGDYNGVLFHRVIKEFMIQTGDPTTRPPELKYPNTPKVSDQNVPAEFRFPQLFHKKGAVAAAREGDETNPERMSSATQFYIVVGKRRAEWELDRIQNRISEATNGEIVLTPEVRETYGRIGGTPHLDGQYTVFGEVLSGMDVVEAIQVVETDEANKPLQDIRVIKAEVIDN